MQREGSTWCALIARHVQWMVLAAIILPSAAAQTATLSPAGLTFLTQVIGTTSAAQTATLTNTSSVSLTITSIQTTGDFAQTNNCGSSLAGSAKCTINVTFTPTAMGSRTGTLSVNDNATPSPQTVSLSGSGTIVSLSPSTLSFGNVSVGIVSAPQSITLTNVGASSLKVTGVSIMGTNAGDFTQSNTCGSSVAANTSCTLTVTFKPTATGSRRATLNVSDNGGASPQTIGLSGTGTTASLVSLAVTPNNPTVAAGITQQFTATGTYSDGSTQNLTSTATWTSSNTVVASINANGLATGLAGGTSTISAVLGTITNSTTLTVTASGPVLTSISVTPVNLTVAIGITQQFTATGNYSDGSTQNLTNSATWGSSNLAVATISNASGSQGLASALAAGATTVTAALGSVSGSTSLTVASTILSTMTPINDLATNGYSPGVDASGKPCDGTNCAVVTFGGGLYPSGSNTVPTVHDTDGRTLASQVQSVEASSPPAVLLCIGMSNMADECGQMISDWQANSNTNTTTLKFLNAAQSGATLCDWTVAASNSAPTCVTPNANPFNAFNNAFQGTLIPNGVKESQVEVIFYMDTNQFAEQSSDHSSLLPCTGNGAPASTYFIYNIKNQSPQPCTTEADAYYYETLMGQMARAVKSRYPNVKELIAYSRNYAGYATGGMPSVPGGTCSPGHCSSSPERYAYEEGFGTKWLVGAQIAQCPSSMTCTTTPGDAYAGDLSYVATSGNACGGNPCAPWIVWASYNWANGTTPRSDGLFWCFGQSSSPCNGEQDFQSDGLHPSITVGEEKTASCTNSWGECNFFLNSPYTEPWFHK